MQALASTPASIYLLLNAAVSGLVYGLLTRYSGTLIPSLADDPLMRSVVAGFGAMAILRTKFFTYRTEGGEEVGIRAGCGGDRVPQRRGSRDLPTASGHRVACALVSEAAEHTPTAGGRG